MGNYRTPARALFCVTFLFWFSQYAYTPYLNPQLQLMGASASFMGLVGGGYGFTQLVLRLPLGISSDRLHRQKLFVIAGCLTSALSAFGMYLWYTPVGFLVFRAVGGFAASTWVSFTVLYGSYFPAGQSSQAITMLNVSNQAGRLSSFVGMAFLTSLLGQRSSFLFSGCSALAACLLCLSVKDTVYASNPIRLRDLPGLLRDRQLFICTVLAVLTQMVAFSTYSAFAVNYASAAGATAAQLSTMNIAMVAPLVAVNYLTARVLLPAFGTRKILSVGFGLTLIYCLVFPFTVSMPQIYAMQALAGVANSLTMSVLLGACVEHIPASSRATAMGFFQAVYGLGMTLGPILMGFLIEHTGMSHAFRLMGIFAAAALALTLLLLPAGRRRHP